MRFFLTFATLLALVFFGFGCTKDDDDPPPPPPDPGLTGTLDTLFGTNGVATYDSGGADLGNGVAPQADGKALVAGYRWNGTDNDIVLLRFNTDGSLDTPYALNGVATFDSGLDDRGWAVALQSDGKALVAGWTVNGTNSDIVLLRFNADGSLDTPFGTTGVAVYDSGGDDWGQGVILQTDGKALVAGYRWNGTDSDIALLRFNTDGSLDTAFGSSGVAVYDGGWDDIGRAVVLQPDGMALVAGDTWNGTDFDVLLLRFQANGSLDTTFGSNGAAVYAGSWDDRGKAVALQADGKALVTGYSANRDIALLRFNANGSLDTTFAAAGIALYNGGGVLEMGNALVLQADGKALVAGYSMTGTDMALVLLRFNTDGTFDTTFGTNCAATYDGGVSDYGNAVVLQSDGKALVAGDSLNGTDLDIVLLRFQ
jgi:uncharacterized delta-60 repeat protein